MRVVFLVVAVVVIVLVVLRARSTKRRVPAAAGTPSLRTAVLRRELVANLPAAADGRARAVLMDWGIGGNAATLVAFDDGTTSLYTSTGGGIVGGGAHETVRTAAAAFRAEAERVRSQFAPVAAGDTFALPAPGQVIFWLVTDGATLRAGPVDANLLAAGQHPLAPLGNAAQGTIAALRAASPP
jgi:hypothetical protein